VNTIVPIENIKQLWITFGNACNHRCIFCFQKDFTERLPESVFPNIERIYPTISACVLQGGEVTIMPHVQKFMHKILSVNSRIKFDIVTNGQEFDESWQWLFARHGRAVHFSINAATQETYEKVTPGGDWNKVMGNLWAIITNKGGSHFPIIRSSMVVTDDNVHEVFLFAKTCELVGVDICNITYDCDHFPADTKLVISEAEKLKDVKIVAPGWIGSLLSRANGLPPQRIGAVSENKTICINPFENIMIDVDGTVRFCCLMVPKIGDLSKSDISEVWNSEAAQKIRQQFIDGAYQAAGCVIERCTLFN
jgi:MoaA/NifB/PqqE/SkfB family radical SAM enzyme